MNNLSQFKKTECTCKECICCCERHPGWFLPKEIPRLAEFLKMSIQTAFEKYLIADFWTGEDDIRLLAPVKLLEEIEEPLIKESISFQKEHNKLMGRDCDKAGSYASWGYAFLRAPCIFLKDNRCSIHPAKPFECAVSGHRKKTENLRKFIAKEWRNVDLPTLVRAEGEKE